MKIKRLIAAAERPQQLDDLLRVLPRLARPGTASEAVRGFTDRQRACILATRIGDHRHERVLSIERREGMPDVSLSLLVLKTRQVDRLRAFYSTLGIALIEERHGNGPVHYAGRVADVVLEIYPLPDGGSPADTTTRLGFTVGKVSEVVEALQAQGHAIVTQPRATEWGFRAVVRDPDGRTVELGQS